AGATVVCGSQSWSYYSIVCSLQSWSCIYRAGATVVRGLQSWSYYSISFVTVVCGLQSWSYYSIVCSLQSWSYCSMWFTELSYYSIYVFTELVTVVCGSTELELL
ncbi:hypothetical protein Hamer_G028705, partial [Homarus americanus]